MNVHWTPYKKEQRTMRIVYSQLNQANRNAIERMQTMGIAPQQYPWYRRLWIRLRHLVTKHSTPPIEQVPFPDGPFMSNHRLVRNTDHLGSSS